MNKKYANYTNNGDAVSMAKNPELPGKNTGQITSPDIPTIAEALRPVHPDPLKGFQPIPSYLRDRITKEIMQCMRKICRERNVILDLDYWENCTRKILGQPSTEDTLIVPSPAGSGKSTWIEAFTRTVVKLFRSEPQISQALTGIAVVLQKVEDLNRLAKVLNAAAPKDSPNMIALQSWTRSGQAEGFCHNTGVKRFEDCHPSSCPFAAACELRSFQNKSLTAPVVGLTQERFAMLRDSGSLDSVLYRTMEDGQISFRRYIIFDEKFPMAQIHTLDKNTLDEASQEITKLISKMSITDGFARKLQRQISYLLEQPFQKLRKSLCISTEHGDRDIQAGFCSLNSLELHQDLQYHSFRAFILEDRQKYASKQLRDAFAVMDSLYNGDQCLFSKTNGFSITHIVPPHIQFGQSQSIIFDATAQIDEDYCKLQHIVFLSDLPKRRPCHINFHIYTHKDLTVSKQAMNSAWKIQSLSQLVAELAEPEDMFLCTYKNHAETFASTLENTMPPETFHHVLLMANQECRMLPYFGGTNGSNLFHTAKQVFILGYPRLNPRDYLIRTCTAYGADPLACELDAVPLEELTSPKLNLLFSLPTMQQYVSHHLAARLEQEIYRCAVRNPDFTGKIDIYLFCPPEDMLDILMERIPGDVICHDELPVCVEVCKAAARRYEDSSTSFGRLALFLKDWDGTPVTPAGLQERLNISKAVWKDLMDDLRVQRLFVQFSVQRKGRGRTSRLYKSGKGE